MLQKRVIPVLLLKDRGLYKGKCFNKHRYIGDPINTIKIFNDKEVDEIIILDIGSNFKPDFEYLQKVTKEAFMPMCYGGGINSFEDAQKLFYIGFEKIAINTLLFKNLSIIQKIIDTFGSQSVVVSLDVKQNFFGKYNVFSHNGRKKVSSDLNSIIELIKKIKVGEILLTSISFEGKMEGYDLKLISQVKENIPTPLIIHGGAGEMKHLELAGDCGADAFACGSMFVFQGIHNAVLITYESFYKRNRFEI